MGIVVCITMLFGLAILRPSPLNGTQMRQQSIKFVLFSAVMLLIFGAWNVFYAYLNLSGFWSWASLISGITMMLASILVFRDGHSNSVVAEMGPFKFYFRTTVIVILALCFLLYAVSLIQLNLGYPILR